MKKHHYTDILKYKTITRLSLHELKEYQKAVTDYLYDDKDGTANFPHVIGIALGWNSFFASIINGSYMIPVLDSTRSIGELSICVINKEKKLLFGDEAWQYKQYHLEETVFYICDLLKDSKRKISDHDISYYSETVLCQFFRYLKKRMFKYIRADIIECVISVPTLDPEVRHTLESHMLKAGFQVKKIMNQTMAASAYFIWKNMLYKYSTARNLICTLDGKYMEISVIEIRDGTIRNLGTVSQNTDMDLDLALPFYRLLTRLFSVSEVNYKNIDQYMIVTDDKTNENKIKNALFQFIQGVQCSVMYGLIQMVSYGASVQSGKFMDNVSCKDIHLIP